MQSLTLNRRSAPARSARRSRADDFSTCSLRNPPCRLPTSSSPSGSALPSAAARQRSRRCFAGIRATQRGGRSRPRAADSRAFGSQRRMQRRADLLTLWNDRAPISIAQRGDPLVMPSVPSLEALQTPARSQPRVASFRRRGPSARSARATGKNRTLADIQLASRSFAGSNETDNWVAVVGFSVPLGSTRTRAAPQMRAAEAEAASLALERESEEISLYATLADAQAAAQQRRAQKSRWRVPTCSRASASRAGQAERAYRAGAPELPRMGAATGRSHGHAPRRASGRHRRPSGPDRNSTSDGRVLHRSGHLEPCGGDNRELQILAATLPLLLAAFALGSCERAPRQRGHGDPCGRDARRGSRAPRSHHHRAENRR